MSGQCVNSFVPKALNAVLSLRVPPGEKRSGEQSQISWAYSQKW